MEKGGETVYDMEVIASTRRAICSSPSRPGVLASSANNGEKRFRAIDETTSVLMRFPDERLATFTCSFGAADVSRYSLIGTKGSLTAEPAYDYSIALKDQSTLVKIPAPASSQAATKFVAELIVLFQA